MIEGLWSAVGRESDVMRYIDTGKVVAGAFAAAMRVVEEVPLRDTELSVLRDEYEYTRLPGGSISLAGESASPISLTFEALQIKEAHVPDESALYIRIVSMLVSSNQKISHAVTTNDKDFLTMMLLLL